MPNTNENTQVAFSPKMTEITGATILLENVTKSYGSKKAAVNQLTLEIPAGQTVMFVGPSGCGKTTTLKMVNRLIEPTSGRIVIDGEDVTNMNGDELRRRIGYVIQAGGLLPHLTVGANVGLVPKMLKWDKQKIAARTDELLELVSLDPEVYRDRYPKELSGGQQQRVGVARALAADPPVLLMDEPFGAVDPITRQRLQEELIHVQNELHKTIVFVTHDFDEAVKLGDWIVIFNEGGKIEQYGTPEQILAHPASEFVEDFIGSGAGLKQLGLARVHEVELHQVPTVVDGEPAKTAADHLAEAGVQRGIVLDSRERPIGWITRRQLERAETVSVAQRKDFPVVGDSSTLDDALDTMLVAGSSEAAVTGARGAYRGLITVQTVIDAIENLNTEPTEVATPIGHNTGDIPTLTTGENGIISYELSDSAKAAQGGSGTATTNASEAADDVAPEGETPQAPWAQDQENPGSERA